MKKFIFILLVFFACSNTYDMKYTVEGNGIFFVDVIGNNYFSKSYVATNSFLCVFTEKDGFPSFISVNNTNNIKLHGKIYQNDVIVNQAYGVNFTLKYIVGD